MLRVECEEREECKRIKLEGRFVGKFAEEARQLAAHCNSPAKIVVDISEVNFVDSVGEEVLRWLGEIGGRFVSGSCYSRDVCERLHLPPARTGSASLSTRRHAARRPSPEAPRTSCTSGGLPHAEQAEKDV